MAQILGYARVSTGDQDVAGQIIRLEQAGAAKVFTDIKSGKSMDRPGLAELLAYARPGDTLAVVRLDRLGRSLADLLSTVTLLRQRQIALLSIEEKNRYVLCSGRTDLSCLRCHRPFRAQADFGAHQGRGCCGKDQRQAARTPTARHKKGRGRHQADRGKNHPRRGRKTTGPWPLHPLPRNAPARHIKARLNHIPASF